MTPMVLVMDDVSGSSRILEEPIVSIWPRTLIFKLLPMLIDYATTLAHLTTHPFPKKNKNKNTELLFKSHSEMGIMNDQCLS